MDEFKEKLFVCFSAKDRYTIVQPIVYHLKNHGINVWYDRYEMVMGDNRYERNILEGAGKCKYALIILSENTDNSICASEEIRILESRYYKKDVTIFPVLYEMDPDNIPLKFTWIKNLIFKEVTHSSGSLEVCNHIVCKITQDILSVYEYQSIAQIIHSNISIPKPAKILLKKYVKIDSANLNARISLLYAVYIIIKSEYIDENSFCEIPIKTFEKLFTETLLNLLIDYRELWLLENSICVLINNYIDFCNESKI